MILHYLFVMSIQRILNSIIVNAGLVKRQLLSNLYLICLFVLLVSAEIKKVRFEIKKS